MSKQKIALFHPWIKSRGGAEKVVLKLLEKSKHSFDVYTWAYDKKNTFEEFEKYNINILSPLLGKKMSRFHILRGLFLPLSIFQKIPLKKYDKLLISTSGVAEFITFRNYKKGNTYAYIHTPLREANKKIVKWNLKNRYNDKPLSKFIYMTSVKIYRVFEKLSWKRLDIVIFNSELSKRRAQEHSLLKNKKSEIIYPPIDFSRFEKIKTSKGKEFVYISRLNPPKRQDLLIKAWNNFSKNNKGYKLILIGTPDNKKYYDKVISLSKSNPSIEIKSNLSNKELDFILSKACAGLFLGYQEDFGIVPLEIIAANKPLLGVDEGGYVKVLEGHPLFNKIKEKHSEKEMIKEIAKKLNMFVKNKKKSTKKKIKLKSFVKEIDKILEK